MTETEETDDDLEGHSHRGGSKKSQSECMACNSIGFDY